MEHHEIKWSLILDDFLQNKQFFKPHLNFILHSSMDITDRYASQCPSRYRYDVWYKNSCESKHLFNLLISIFDIVWLLTVLTAPAAILIAGTASLTLLCDVQICSRRRMKQRLGRLSTGCFQKRKITISKMVGVAGWALGLNLSRSCGKGSKDSIATTYFAVRNASMFTSAPTPNALAHIGVPLSGGNVTYILRKAIELEGPDRIPQCDIYHQEGTND